MKFFKVILLAIIVTTSLNGLAKPLVKKTEHYSIIVEELASKLGLPWGMDFIDQKTMLISIRSGKFLVLDTKTKKARELSYAPKVWDNGQGGLLDVKKDPSSKWIYFTYSKPIEDDQAATTLARAEWKNKELTNAQDLLITKSTSDETRHFGSRIAFKNDHIFFSIGDRGHRPNGQDLSSHAGSVLRVTKTGKTVNDNPFIKEKNALPEIWSYGHRNPQGLFYDQKRDILWLMEHGPRGGDEINIVEKGKNYGWPEISYGKEYWGPFDVGDEKKAGMEQPWKYYVPSIAPCGLMVYSGKVFKKWEGNLFSGALKLSHLNRQSLEKRKAGQEERILNDMDWRIRNVIEGPDGLIYFSTDEGSIYQIKKSS